MYRIRPRSTVLSGAAIGLIAGFAAYGAMSSPAWAPTPTAFKPAVASQAVAPAHAAPCGAGHLEHGVCTVHVVRTIVVPSKPSAASSTAGGRTSEPADHHDGPSEALHGD